MVVWMTPLPTPPHGDTGDMTDIEPGSELIWADILYN